MRTCVTYARVSSEEQEKVGFSIPFQRAKLEEFARESGFTIAARFEDVHSAKATGRPGFQELLRFLEAHPEVHDILVHRVDRLIRNHYEYGLVVEQLGARVHSFVERAEDNAAGRLFHGMNVVVAKYHSDNLSQEVRKGQRTKFLAGGCPYRAPVGYRNIMRTHTEKAKVVVDEEMAPLVRRLFERYVTGRYSFAHLADELFDEGLRTRAGKPYPQDRIRRLLRHPFYRGQVRYRGEIRPGAHEPIISSDLFDRAQQVMDRRSEDHGEKGANFFLLRGILLCGGCTRRMTAEHHPKGSYYRCPSDPRRDLCPERYFPVRELDTAVEALLPRIALRDGARVIAALHRIADVHEAVRNREVHRIAARRDAVDAKLTALTDGYASGKVPEPQYVRLVNGYQRELDALDREHRALTTDIRADIAALEQILDTATHVADLYALADSPAAKKDHLRHIFRRITVKSRTIVGIEYHPPFDLLLGEPSPADAGSDVPLERSLLEFVEHER